ncbi:PadR family transcriptional regulator [Bifidobacterium sp. UBA744]|uniref:PadR family transcriptional regulator n=1 Tax=Bifidobacterium sp. UBA744 TaxID=1946112 RepID=UPI0025BAED60|nr:PadR family transcriptional regulator [Bifidobacterium sp. UBA744]
MSDNRSDGGRVSSPKPRWPALWVRAALRTAVLQTLEPGPLHGYGIALALSDAGFGRPKGGSLYPILEELVADGCMVASWREGDGGPGRKVYELTEAGTDRLGHEREQWNALAAALNAGAAMGRRNAGSLESAGSEE